MTRIIVERIQLPFSQTPGEKPPATLLDGELWINEADHLAYIGITGKEATPLDGVSTSPLFQEIDALKTLLKPIIDNGFHSAAEVSGHGGVPLLDVVGQIDPSMIGGTAHGPARAGEVPKFKPNGLIEISLLDWDYRSVSAPSTNAVIPTAADANKLVRLDHEGRIDSRFLGINTLDYKGTLHIEDRVSLTGEILDGQGRAGSAWIVSGDKGLEYNVNLSTGQVAAATKETPAGWHRMATGDVLIKDSNLTIHHIDADVMPIDHLLARDGSRPMVGDLIFQSPTTTGEPPSIFGVREVHATTLFANSLEAADKPGAPGEPHGELRHWVIDGSSNALIMRHGPDPTLGRVDGKAGEIYVDTTPGMAALFLHDGVGWQMICSERSDLKVKQLEADVALLRSELDAIRLTMTPPAHP